MTYTWKDERVRVSLNWGNVLEVFT